jgi:hypothetical protein
MKNSTLTKATAKVSDPTTVIHTTVTTVTTVAPMPSPVKTVLDFEDREVRGLLSASYFQGATVAKDAMVTDQYINMGFVIEHAAIADLGIGHAVSGTLAIVPVSSLGKVALR